MTERDALELLEYKLSTQIAEFNNSRQFYRRSHFHLTITTAIASSLTTVLIGAGSVIRQPWWSLLPLFVSACVTAVAAYEAFLRPKDMWVQKTNTWMALQNILENLEYEKSKNETSLSQDEIDAFYRRFENAIMSEHQLWMTVRTSRDHGSAHDRHKIQTHPQPNDPSG
jgi:hypothetical protein